ncbi:ribulose-phosphate 3-epimerase [Deinococcus sp. KNUC1210]|uniref:ribulose-phosphate 3-epimerase n=1 Tax=Deinococcus sp. KNUC1210 TaxID=2917691 RepID=UPI001EF029AF|nr:ribulose-phosphate 3-epimerase [Deinococcus sp. KNUC1210]ULH15395.1 ribulose-phosphate 3-epimerase [Deinococcus sp. KNUC1210]
MPPLPVLLAPSILASDFTRLGQEIESIQDAEYLHVDVMDGLFVPNISFGFPILEAARRTRDALGTDQMLDVHLMIERPERYLKDFVSAGADSITVHVEATPHVHRCVQTIRELGKRAGVVLNPGTSLETLRPLLGSVDLILIMSVNPGFGGQSFLPQTYERVQTVRRWLEDAGSEAVLEVDGGVTADNARQLAQAGATALVAGSSVFGADGGRAGLARLRASLS